MKTDLTSARRVDGWGFVAQAGQAAKAPPPALVAWLREALGPGEPFPSGGWRRWTEAPDLPAGRVGEVASVSGVEVLDDPVERVRCARGQGLPDLLRLRTGRLLAVPDAVLRPVDDGALEHLVTACAQRGVKLIPRGGGTSVTGGVNVLGTAGATSPESRAGLAEEPTVVVDLSALSGLRDLDSESGLATFGAGTFGPQVEAALAPEGWTLGHFPQSWELSTVGGWVATRSSGQESLGYGGISELVAGVQLVAPRGRWKLGALPASASGPDLRQTVLGSEGRFGVITSATLRLHRRPAGTAVKAWMLPTWQEGLAAARALMRGQIPLTLLRLSDEAETEAALAAGLESHPLLATWVRKWLAWRGIHTGCLLLLGAADGTGSGDSTDTTQESGPRLRRAGREISGFGAVGLGAGPGKKWLADRFRHPYLRDSLLDLGYATETLETAAPWSRLPALADAVRKALAPLPVLCHVSHPYPDGASLYFTFFFPCPPEPGDAIARWARLKRAATAAVVASGGALSHHHGVGSWHAPWLQEEIGTTGVDLLRATAEHLDPAGILNPHVLLDPYDRLEA